MVRAVIIDDEPLAREKIKLFSQKEPDLKIVASCENGSKALEAIVTHSPDLLFLDIQMPEMTGFQLLEKIPKQSLPGIIFITAYDEFALRAFEFHALDYLLKPFDKNRFHNAVEHAKKILSNKGERETATEQISVLLNSLKKTSPTIERLIVKTHGRILFLRISEVDWIESAGNYVKLHINAETHLLRETMNHLEERLDKTAFVRIHRSAIVNIERIKEMQPWFNGEYKIVLKNLTELILSKTYRESFLAAVGKPL